MTAEDAARGVQAMAGAHRIPAMLRRVDRLSRGWETATASSRG